MMVRPTSLLRSDSDRPQFRTPVVAIKKESIDCGIVNLIPCCLPTWCHRFATPRVFLSCLTKLALLQGALHTYFVMTLSNVQELYGYSNTLVEWLAVSHDIFMGIFGLLIAHHGSIKHKPVWIGALACFQGVASILVVIPYNEFISLHGEKHFSNTTSPNLCKETRPHNMGNLELISDYDSNAWITLSIFVVFQILTGLANASFYAHGFSYLDDNTEKHASPVFLCMLIALRMCSIQVGSFMTWYYMGSVQNWGAGFSLLGGIVIKMGIVIILFPKQLLTTIMKKTVANIVETARSGSTEALEEVTEDPKYLGFWPSFKRVITNKIIIINTLSSVFMYMALDNFSYYEGRIMEAQFYLPTVGEGFDDPWTSRLVRNIVRTPTTALFVIISGLLISKFQPKARKLAIWSVITSIIVTVVLILLIFIRCEKDTMVGEYRNYLISPYCSNHCNCDVISTKFEPVCTQDKNTYYSPCHAGCGEIRYINNIKFYGNCTCSTGFENFASPGACTSDDCSSSWMIFQSLSVVSHALIASTFVCNLLITLRSVLPSDKSMAVALELALTGILVHLPGKSIYAAIAGANCKHLSQDGLSCSLHNEKFAIYLSVLTACLLAFSAALDTILVYFVKDLELYDDNYGNNNSGDNGTEMNTVQRMSSIDPRTFEAAPERAGLLTRATVEEQPRISGDVPSVSSSSVGRPESDPPRYSDIENRRPLRPKSTSRTPTRVISSEDDPLTDRTENDNSSPVTPVRRSMTPRARDGLPMGNEEVQRDLINEFRQKQGTNV